MTPEELAKRLKNVAEENRVKLLKAGLLITVVSTAYLLGKHHAVPEVNLISRSDIGEWRKMSIPPPR